MDAKNLYLINPELVLQKSWSKETCWKAYDGDEGAEGEGQTRP